MSDMKGLKGTFGVCLDMDGKDFDYWIADLYMPWGIYRRDAGHINSFFPSPSSRPFSCLDSVGCVTCSCSAALVIFSSLAAARVVSNPLPVFCSKTLILREVAAKRALPPLFCFYVNRQTNISKKEINAHEHYTLSSSIM